MRDALNQKKADGLPGEAGCGGCQEAHWYRTLLRALPDAYLSIDWGGRVVEWSPRAQELFGWPAELVVGADARQLCLPDLYEAGRGIGLPLFVRLSGRRGGGGIPLYLAVNARGEEFPVELSIVDAPSGEGQASHLCLLKDISQRLIAEERLAQAAKMEAIGELASGLAHDFNNVLGIVVGSLETLATRLPDPGDRELVDLALMATERGGEVTRSMQAVARRRPIKPETVDINALLRDLASLLQHSVTRTMELSMLAEAAAALVHIDIGSFNNVMLNLVINARDAMPRGGVVMIYTQNVEITSGDTLEAVDLQPGHYVVVGVDDSGEGMPPEVVARAMEPFFTTKPKGKGTGLGLAMAYAFARQSAGVLRIRSKPGRGTNIHLFIPCLRQPAGRNQGVSDV